MPVQINDFEGILPNENKLVSEVAIVATLCIVLKSIMTTQEPAATQSSDSWHIMFTGAPETEVVPIQHDDRREDDAFTSQTLIYNRNSQQSGFKIIKIKHPERKDG